MREPQAARRLPPVAGSVNAQQEAVALWRFYQGRGIKPSIRSIGRALRDQKIRCRDADLFLWLSKFRAAAVIQAEAKTVTTGSTWQQPGSGFARAAKVSLPSKPLSSGSKEPSEPAPFFEMPPANVTPLRRPKKAKDLTWRKPLVDTAEALLQREIRTWSAEERFTWARWHCLVFANCTADEGRNRTQASRVAKGLASMALSVEYGDVTGAEYYRLAKIIHAQRDKTPWFDPWMIKGAIESQEAVHA